MRINRLLERDRQYVEAVAWCLLPGNGPKKAVDSLQGTMMQLECLKLNLKKERAHVTRKLKNHHHMALTAHEEDELAETLIYMEYVGGGWTRAELSNAVITIVEALHYINKHLTPRHPFVWLSTAANTIRAHRRVGKAWFTRFLIDWSHLISERKPQTLSAIRAQFCTRQMSLLHFTQLGDTLRKFGLRDSTGIITKPDNAINYDE